MSRSACGPGESGTAKHAQAAQPKAAASITHQRNDVSDQRAKEDADEYERGRHSTSSNGRIGRRR